MEFVNSKGVKYWLHFKEINFGRGQVLRKNYFFCKTKDYEGCERCEIPIGFHVIETIKGMPVLKRL